MKTLSERLEALQAAVQPLSPDDAIAEAGRKILLGEWIKALGHEDGTRTGEDIEDVHDMRVATRRMRSLFRLLAPYYKRSVVRHFQEGLRRLAWALGGVRDLDVLLANLHQYQGMLDEAGQAALLPTLERLERERAAARGELVELLDSKVYRRFVKEYSAFVTGAGSGVKTLAPTSPSQVRHVLPSLIYNRLGAVQAYETVLDGAAETTLHALRIEFKRLRYLVSLFESVLGDAIDDYITQIKALQDALGEMNDGVAARTWLEMDAEEPVVAAYLASLDADEAAHRQRFEEQWARFNTRKVQQKLSTAVLALR